MGFLDHTTNNIIVDAVLTDEGRKKLASADGLNIRMYAFADTEVDYSLLLKYGEVVGKEKIEKNTPIFEANTADSQAGRHTFLTDTIGGKVENIAISGGNFDGTDYVYTVDFAGFSTDQVLNYEIFYSHKVWTPVEPSDGIAGVNVTPDIHKVTNLSVTAGNTGEQTITVKLRPLEDLAAGTYNASWKLVLSNSFSSNIQTKSHTKS